MWMSAASIGEVAASAASTLLAATSVPAQLARAGSIGTAKIAQVGSALCWPPPALQFWGGVLKRKEFYTEERAR